jgi:hypothetical protein
LPVFLIEVSGRCYACIPVPATVFKRVPKAGTENGTINRELRKIPEKDLDASVRVVRVVRGSTSSAISRREYGIAAGIAKQPAPWVLHPIFAPYQDSRVVFRDRWTVLGRQKRQHLFAAS